MDIVRVEEVASPQTCLNQFLGDKTTLVTVERQ